MTEGPLHRVQVLSAWWQRRDTELSFVIRAVAGAASRSAAVDVVTPMPAGAIIGDGAFDLLGIGKRPEGGWPDTRETDWVPSLHGRSTWVIDEPSKPAVDLFEALGDGSIGYSVSRLLQEGAPGLTPLPLLPGRGSQPSGPLGVYVPVNPLAATHRHAGLGFSGYLLVLSDRSSTPMVAPPTPAVAWLTARFHRQYVVAIEGGRAAVWKGRALRGIVGVDSRIDLWRLIAHAWATVDLAPGQIIARECVESLRFGTPIIVPGDAPSPAAMHAGAGGGFTFSDLTELLECVERMLVPAERERCSSQGSDYANSLYGDPVSFVDRVSSLLSPD